MGGAVFVRAGGSLLVNADGDAALMSGNSLAAGRGALSVNNGVAVGRGLFAMAGASITVDIAGVQRIEDDIADDSLASIPAGQHFTPGNSAGAGLIKQGGGTLVLAASDNHYAGTTTVHAGVLQVDGMLADSPVLVDGGTLAGTGVAQSVTLAAGGTLAPGEEGGAPGVLSATALTWHGDGAMRIALGAPGDAANSDRLMLSGNLVKGDPGTYRFHFGPGTGMPAAGTYTLIEAAGTDFTAADFSYDVALPLVQLDGSFVVDGGTVRFVVAAATFDSLFANGFE
jgi:autotransporter-associated beta strand protein